MAQTVSITVDGLAYVRAAEPRLLLTHFIRDVIGLTGTNVGCDTSQCGGQILHGACGAGRRK